MWKTYICCIRRYGKGVWKGKQIYYFMKCWNSVYVVRHISVLKIFMMGAKLASIWMVTWLMRSLLNTELSKGIACHQLCLAFSLMTCQMKANQTVVVYRWVILMSIVYCILMTLFWRRRKKICSACLILCYCGAGNDIWKSTPKNLMLYILDHRAMQKHPMNSNTRMGIYSEYRDINIWGLSSTNSLTSIPLLLFLRIPPGEL